MAELWPTVSLENLAWPAGRKSLTFTRRRNLPVGLQNMRDVAAEWAFEIDIRDMPGRSMLAMWVTELNDTCGPPPRVWQAPILGE